MSRIEKRFPPIGEFLTVDDVRLHYQRAGEGPALALIHGASGNLRDWDFGIFDAIARTNDTISFDRPGFGYSDRPLGAQDPAVQAALLKEAAKKLGLNKPIVLGHSYADVVVNIEIQSDQLAQRLPHANYIWIKGLGHMPQHVAQSEILEMLGRLNASIS